ncbi:MAG: hypothetical protein QXK66_00900 [Sulfolobales archaeon]
MALTAKRRPLSPSDIISLITKLELQLGYLTHCYGFRSTLKVDVSDIKQSEGIIVVEGNFRCEEYSKTVKEGKFRASLDDLFNIIEFSITPYSEG